MLAVPQRLEQAIGEAQRHDVLHRLLAEEMVDPIDLVLLQRLQDLGIERLGRGEVVAERLFDHHPAPLAVCFRHQPGATEPGNRHGEETVGDGEVEEPVARRARGLVELRQMRAETAVGGGIVEVALQIAHAVGEPTPSGLVDMIHLELAAAPGDEFAHHVGEALAPFRGGLGGEVDADQLERLGQPLGRHQIVERRHDQPLGQVAGGAEDHHGARRRYRGLLGMGRALALILLSCRHRLASGHGARLLDGSPALEQFHGARDDPLRLESELALQLLERRGGAEGLHADDAAVRPDIALPAQRRALLDRDARRRPRAAARSSR